jgi:predicted Zn-dependent protease
MRRLCLFSLVVLFALAFAVTLSAGRLLASPLPPSHRSRSDKNINDIGHRKIAQGPNFYSSQQEAQLGKQYSAEFDRSATLLREPAITDYVAWVAQNLARNSDADLPITVQVIDSEEVRAFALPGGYQYISRGLLLRLEGECELASVLARGIAHTALHSATREATYAKLTEIASIPLIMTGQGGTSSSTSSIAVPLTLIKWRQEDELDADYFGVQYLSKAGYDSECFIRSVQRVWPASPASVATSAFSPLPSLPERLKALQKEIADLLPKRDGAIVSTPEFEEFKVHLKAWRPEKAEPRRLGEK